MFDPDTGVYKKSLNLIIVLYKFLKVKLCLLCVVNF